VLGLLEVEIKIAAHVASLLRIWPRVGRTNPKQLAKRVEAIRQKLLEQARDFRDSWPWPTAQKPDDLEDAAAAHRALQALPPFEALARMAQGHPAPPEENPREEFNRLVRQWREERGPSSSARRMAACPSYRAIVAMGQAAIPFLLAELQRHPDHWFIALHELTGSDPVPKEARGRLDDMAAAWVKWGKENGFIS
jgi:hypothetical protein